MRDELSKRSVEQQQQQQRVSKKCHLFLGRLNLFDNFLPSLLPDRKSPIPRGPQFE